MFLRVILGSLLTTSLGTILWLAIVSNKAQKNDSYVPFSFRIVLIASEVIAFKGKHYGIDRNNLRTHYQTLNLLFHL